MCVCVSVLRVPKKLWNISYPKCWIFMDIVFEQDISTYLGRDFEIWSLDFEFFLTLNLKFNWIQPDLEFKLNLDRKDTSCSAFWLWNIFSSLLMFFYANLWWEIFYVHVCNSCFLTTLIFISVIPLQEDCKSCFIFLGWSSSTPNPEALERCTSLRKWWHQLWISVRSRGVHRGPRSPQRK